MKQLFVTYTKEKKKKEKEEHQEIFLCCERKEEKNDINEITPLLTITENHLNQQVFNSYVNSTTNSSTDSRKISENNINTDPKNIFNLNISNKYDNSTNRKNNPKLNKFLGKKSKIHFDVIKNGEKEEKEANFNISSSLNNSKIIEGPIVNKDNNNECVDLNEEYSINENEKETIKQKKSSSNVGRWSYCEHIKFIEAVAEYGKNWSDVQEYIGTRSSSQARSHAQKFLMKLKTIKNNNFNFNNRNIKSISDVIEVIKRKEEYINGGKDYIINTLIKLSEKISYESIDLYKTLDNNIKTTIDLNYENKKNNNNKDTKFDIFNVIRDIDFQKETPNQPTDNKSKSKSKNKQTKILKKTKDNQDDTIYTNNNNTINIQDNDNNNNDNKNTKEKKDINNNIINLNNNNSQNQKNENKNGIKDIIYNKNIIDNNNNITNMKDNKNMLKENDSSKININRSINNNENNINKKNYNGSVNKNYYTDEPKRQRYIFDDGIIYLTDDSNFLDLNDISLKIKNFYFLKNFESPISLYNKYFFS